MKRLAFIVAMLFCFIAWTGCEDANIKKLKEEVAKANARCPENFGIAGDLLSVKYYEKNNTVLMYYALNEEVVGHVFLKQNKENMQKQLRLALSQGKAYYMVKDIVNAKASIMVIFKAASSGKTIKYNVPYKVLKDISEHPMTDNEIKRMMLENSIAMQNVQPPGSKEEDGMSCSRVAIVDDNVVYYILVDENMYDIKTIKNGVDEIKQSMVNELLLQSKDPIGKREFELMTSLDMGYIFRYYGDKSCDYVDVVFTSDELNQFL